MKPISLNTSEQKLICLIKEWLGDKYVGDDCAVLPNQNLITSDTLVEGTHFDLSTTSLNDLGWKAVAVNLSDIAAMAGRPRQLVVNLTLPETFHKNQFQQLFLSMIECAQTFRTTIVGGDLTAGPCLSITLTVVGETHECGCLMRSGSRQGDVVIASGNFGGSRAGLWLLGNDICGFKRSRQAHTRPLPRLCEAWFLIRQTGNRAALMDASDGLADALLQIAKASSVGMEIDPQLIPIDSETIAVAQLAQAEPIDWALYGGEDYELVGTVCNSDWQTMRKSPNNPFKAIGDVVANTPFVVMKDTGRELDFAKTFQHWQNME